LVAFGIKTNAIKAIAANITLEEAYESSMTQLEA